jgi:prepilin-type processing-associated H-X9-DG protein
MKAALFTVALLACGVATAQTYVKPHVTKNGTYVDGHVRTNPNNTNTDNYGTKGNYNPYTGQAGTVQPNYAPQQPQCRIAQNGQYICK